MGFYGSTPIEVIRERVLRRNSNLPKDSFEIVLRLYAIPAQCGVTGFHKRNQFLRFELFEVYRRLGVLNELGQGQSESHYAQLFGITECGAGPGYRLCKFTAGL